MTPVLFTAYGIAETLTVYLVTKSIRAPLFSFRDSFSVSVSAVTS